MTDQIGPNDRNSSDWSVAKYLHERVHVLNAKSCAGSNAAIRLVSNVVVLPWQWHDYTTKVVSNVELNGPFPSCCLSRFRSESWSSTVVSEMSLICIRIRQLISIWMDVHQDSLWNWGMQQTRKWEIESKSKPEAMKQTFRSSGFTYPICFNEKLRRMRQTIKKTTIFELSSIQ